VVDLDDRVGLVELCQRLADSLDELRAIDRAGGAPASERPFRR
jgi:hypothetical protein